MLRNLFANRNLSMFALFVAGIAMAAIVGLVGGNHQAAAAGECGSSYSLSRTYPVMNGSERTGTLELYWSNATKKNCAINRCYGGGVNGCGMSLFRSAKIKLSSQASWPTSGQGSDQGTFANYAGPVYVYAPNSCIDAYAGLAFWDGHQYHFEGGRYAYKIMCG